MFEALERDAGNDSLHLQLAETMLLTASSVDYRHTWFNRGVLSGNERGAAVNVWLSPRLRLTTEFIDIHQESVQPSVLTGVPGVDRQIGVALTWRHAFGESALGVTAAAVIDLLVYRADPLRTTTPSRPTRR